MNRDAMLSGVYDSELRRVTGMVAVIWQLALLAQVLIYLGDYRRPLVPVAVWLGMLAAAAWLVPRARAAGLSLQDAAVAVGVAVAAVLVVGLDRRANGTTGTVDWSVAGTGWLLALVAVSRPVWEWICGAAAVFAIHTIVAARVLGFAALGLARLASTAYLLLVILLVFVAIRPMFRASARIAGRRAELESRSAARRAAALAVREDRRRRLAVLEAEALPLLRGIADGSLDPSAPAVREQCRRRAAALRGALRDHVDSESDLVTGLEPVLAAAAQRGVEVGLQMVGDPGPTRPEVIGLAGAAVSRVLSVLRPQQVVLTVLAPGGDVELYLVFPGPLACSPREVAGAKTRADPAAYPRSAGQVTRGCHEAVEIDDSGAGCLEMRWPKETA